MSTEMNTAKPSALIIGGGIGGMAAALSLARIGVPVTLLEQAAQIAEIGAGLQLGPNAFAALDALGVGEAVRCGSVFTDRMVMMDAVDCSEVATIPVGEAFRMRFNNPYAVTHRADLHNNIFDAVKANGHIQYYAGAHVKDVTVTEHEAAVTLTDSRVFKASAIVGCDGVKSVVRQKLIGDEARVTGHVVYRAVVPVADMPEDLRWKHPWCGRGRIVISYITR
jgi:3-hydroxybenzoate 6-monooxygenase